MSPPSGRRTRSMTIVGPAPTLHPAEPGPALLRLLEWQTSTTYQRTSDLDRQPTRDLFGPFEAIGHDPE